MPNAMKAAKQVFSFVAIGMLLTACSSGMHDATYHLVLDALLDHAVKDVTVLASKESRPHFWLDARSRREFEVSHIAGAIWVGEGEIDTTVLSSVQKDQQVTVYCSLGLRSESTVVQMQSLGYSNVSNLYGGLFEWINHGESVVDSHGQTTNKVHPYNAFWGIWLRAGEKQY